MNSQQPGALEWGIKMSLLLYATSAPGGGISTEGVTSANGSFTFPLRSQGVDEYLFNGSVAVFAHYGAPIATFAQLRVYLGDNAQWFLEMNPDEGAPVVAFALSGQEADSTSLSFTTVELTDIGSEMFGGYYSPGEQFEPILIQLP